MLTRCVTFMLHAVCFSLMLMMTGMHCAHTKVNAYAPCGLSNYLCKQMSEWKKDAGGCLHIRSFQMAKNIVDSLPENLRNIDSMRNYLGPADNSQANSDYKVLDYYYNSFCTGKVPVDSADKQWVEFVFNAQTLRFESVADYHQ